MTFGLLGSRDCRRRGLGCPTWPANREASYDDRSQRLNKIPNARETKRLTPQFCESHCSKATPTNIACSHAFQQDSIHGGHLHAQTLRISMHCRCERKWQFLTYEKIK